MTPEELQKALFRILNYTARLEKDCLFIREVSRNKTVNELLRRLGQANKSICEDLLKQLRNRADIAPQLDSEGIRALGAINEMLFQFDGETLQAIETQIEILYNNSKPQ